MLLNVMKMLSRANLASFDVGFCPMQFLHIMYTLNICCRLFTYFTFIVLDVPVSVP